MNDFEKEKIIIKEKIVYRKKNLNQKLIIMLMIIRLFKI